MKNLKLTIELIPEGAWGSNLRKRLPKKDWDTLRHDCYERANYHCIICGDKKDNLDAHEVWDFNIPTKTQTLVDIIALCKSCHLVKHIKHAEAEGKLDIAKRHFYKINKCDTDTFAQHYIETKDLFEKRNKVDKWELKAPQIEFSLKEQISIINPYQDVNWEAVVNILNSESLPLPSKICSVTVDGSKITVVAERATMIEWIAGDNVVNSVANRLKRFTTTFNIKDVENSEIRFRLIGEGGQTESSVFGILRG